MSVMIDHIRVAACSGGTDKIVHAFQYDIQSGNTIDLLFDIDRNGTGHQKPVGESIGYNIHIICFIGLDGSSVPGTLPDREGKRLSGAIQFFRCFFVYDKEGTVI